MAYAPDIEIPSLGTCRDLVLSAMAELGGRAVQRAVIFKALELGSFSPEQLGVPSPPAVPGRRSFIEYRLGEAMADLKAEGVLANPAWGLWSLPAAAPRAPRPSRTRSPR